MTRPIKFRAWDFENKIMHTPKIHHDEKFVLQLNCNYIGEFNGKKYESIKMNLLQFTGLTDRNGVEIYEGDVVKCSRGCPHVIEFMKEVPCSNIGGMPGFYFSSLNEGYAWTGKEEVIGNIYEHPELLKGGNPA